MTDKPKIHVFLGAPRPPYLTPAGGPEEDPGQWKTLELCWQGGRLRPRKDHDGTQAADVCRGDSTSAEQRGTAIDIVNEGVDGLNPTEVPERETLSVMAEGSTALTQVHPAPSPTQSSQRKRALTDEEALCPEAVTEYLDSCFPAAQADPVSVSDWPEAQPGRAVSMETEYLSAWTVGQALLLRGRAVMPPYTNLQGEGSPCTPPKQTPPASGSSPDLYSPMTSSKERGLCPATSPRERGLGGTLQASLELFYDRLSQRQQEGGVILEYTPNGILCSQGSAALSTETGVGQVGSPLQAGSPCSPTQISPIFHASKKSKLSPVTAKGQGGADQIRETNAIVPSGPTTLLSRCRTHGVRYSILVAVVHPCHLKEIKVKSGASAGSSVPLATVIVTDQSGVEMKVVLWRTAAFWALTVYPGDLLLITGVKVNVDKWRGERVLQSFYTSRLLNLGQLSGSRIPPVPQNVNGHTFRALCAHLRERHPLLVSLPPRTPQDLHLLPHARLGALRPDTLVHALLRVKHTNMVTAWRAEAEGMSRAGSVLKAMLTVEQGDGHQGAMVLWGAALAWLQRIQRNKDAVWEFRVMLVRQDVTSGLLELHSTPWGTCEPLFPDDTRCLEFYKLHRPGRTSTSFEIDLHTLLSQKHTGDVELRVQITAFQFQGSPSQDAVHLMDGDTPLERILDMVSGDVTFTGCGRCTAELDTDENGIYRLCYPCLPHTGVRRYYRPVVLTVKERDSQVCVQVPPALVQKVLLDTPPDKLSKTVAPSSTVRFVQVVADRIHSMLSVPRSTFLLTIRSHFLCDENSIPIVQTFLLLDFNSLES